MLQNDKNAHTTYEHSLHLAAEHYENFPVASFLFPRKLRKDVALIYRFARTADDIADEGNLSDEERIAELNFFRRDFEQSIKGEYSNKFWELLKLTIDNRNLSPNYFSDLLDAFEQDLRIKRYQTFKDLLGYCRKSANPVGRLLLELYGIRGDEILLYSDKICTALQLTNFWQDVKIDLKKDRIYIPLEDFSQSSCNENEIFAEQTGSKLRQIVKRQVDKTALMFREGSGILEHLPYRLQLQVGWTINGGEKILNKIRKNNFEVLNYRPTLSRIDYVFAFLQTFVTSGK